MNVEAVAALAPASDLVGLLEGLETLPGGSVFATYTVFTSILTPSLPTC